MENEKLDFKVPALRICQRERKGQAIYLTKVKVKEFGTRPTERFTIDYYQRIPVKRDQGYQRPLSERAIEKVKEFILRETPNPLLPTAILANSRYPLDFKEQEGGFGTLHIKDRLFIIDGQHRLEAWKSMMADSQLQEQWGDYELPVVILSGFESYQEIEQFYVINSRQKKIKTDLAQRHLLQLASHKETSGLVSDSEYWKLYSTKIVDVLNEQLDNIWKGKIILPSDSKDLRKAKIISQSSFVSSLKPFFIGKGAIFTEEIPNGKKIEEWAKIIARFWDLVAEVYPEAIKRPHDYSLMKTVGVFSLHIFLQREILRTGLDNLEKTLKDVAERLREAVARDFSISFWRSKVPSFAKEQGKYAGAFSSAVGHNRIAAGIMMGSQI